MRTGWTKCAIFSKLLPTHPVWSLVPGGNQIQEPITNQFALLPCFLKCSLHTCIKCILFGWGKTVRQVCQIISLELETWSDRDKKRLNSKKWAGKPWEIEELRKTQPDLINNAQIAVTDYFALLFSFSCPPTLSGIQSQVGINFGDSNPNLNWPISSENWGMLIWDRTGPK